MAKKKGRISDTDFKLGILLLSFTTVMSTVFNFATSQGYLQGDWEGIFGVIFLGIAVVVLGVIAWRIVRK